MPAGAAVKHRKPAPLAPLELLEFDRDHWSREGDRRFSAFHRWQQARVDWEARHPGTLGDPLTKMRTEMQAQFTPEHYPPGATEWTNTEWKNAEEKHR
jgi:hypothetical protein